MSSRESGSINFRRVDQGYEVEVKAFLSHQDLTQPTSFLIQKRIEQGRDESTEIQKQQRRNKVLQLLSRKAEQSRPARESEIEKRDEPSRQPEAQDRERTRQRATRPAFQPTPPPPRVKQSLIQVLNARSKRLTFQSKFNVQDNIFAIYRNTFSMRSQRHEGFMIVNDQPCESTSSITFKIQLHNTETDRDNDCSVGITYEPVDLFKRKLKNPVKKCMAYSFANHRLSTGGHTYGEKTIEGVEARTYIFYVDIPKGKFLLASEKEVIVDREIPLEFKSYKLHIFLQLRNKGRISIL